mgnify:FL=1
MTMLDDWDYKTVQDFDCLEDIWNRTKNNNVLFEVDGLGKKLETQLDLPNVLMDQKTSCFFKRQYKNNWENRGIMIKESGKS